jgi:hypothetical protein
MIDAYTNVFSVWVIYRQNKQRSSSTKVLYASSNFNDIKEWLKKYMRDKYGVPCEIKTPELVHLKGYKPYLYRPKTDLRLVHTHCSLDNFLKVLRSKPIRVTTR